MGKHLFIWIVKLVAALILLQTLFFKFTGAEESIYIFTRLGIEPFGRIGSGIIELVAAVFLLIPRTTLLGALLGFATMLAAVFSHIFILGIAVKGDGGELFSLALLTLFCCTVLIYQYKNKLHNLLCF